MTKNFFFFSFEGVNLSTFYKGRWHGCCLGLFGGQFGEHSSNNTLGLSVRACMAHILCTFLKPTGTHPITTLCGSALHMQLDRAHRQESRKFFTITEPFRGACAGLACHKLRQVQRAPNFSLISQSAFVINPTGNLPVVCQRG